MAVDAALVGVLLSVGFLGLGIAIFVILRYWLVDGTLDTAPALGVLLALLIGSSAVVKSGSLLFMLLWAVLLLGGSLGLPMLAAKVDRHALYELYEKDIERYRRVLELNAANAAAWREMGEIYFKMNRYDEAIAAYKEAIRLDPHDVQDIRRRLNRALDYRSGEAMAETVLCEHCGQETVVGSSCRNCGAPLETNFFQWFLQARNLQEILNPTVAIIAVVIAFLTTLSGLPVGGKAIVLAVCVAVGGFCLWRAVRAAD